MEGYNDKPQDIFSFSIDETGKAYMLETARWAKFLSIIGLIFSGLMFVGLLFIMLNFSDLSRQLGTMYGGLGAGVFFFYFLILVIILYPTITLFRFASKIKPAILTANQELFNTALKNLKNTFKFWGIYVIVILALYGLALIVTIVAAAASGL